MAGTYPDQAVRLPLGRMRWDQTTFLHYPCAADELARYLPPGLTPHLFEGQAWLSVTPLIMRQVRPAGLPSVPGWSTFPELNVRTYVNGPCGNDGIWFFRLDCPRRLMVWGMNRLGLHYRHREAGFSEEPGAISYQFHGGKEHALNTRIGEPIETPSDRDVFLTGRWNVFTQRLKRLVRTPIAHEPWPLYTATATGSMLTAPRDLGFPILTSQPIVQYSPGVDVRVAAPRRAGW